MDIASLTNTDTATGSEKPLQMFKKNRIKILKAWNQYQNANHAIERVDWMDKLVASQEAYNIFWVSLYDPDNSNPQPFSSLNTPVGSLAQSTPGGLPNISPTNPKSLAAEFEKSMKETKLTMRNTLMRNSGIIGGERLYPTYMPMGVRIS